MSNYFDTHAHLDYPDFAADMAQVIERARVAGITRIISIGTDFESTRRAIKLASGWRKLTNTGYEDALG